MKILEKLKNYWKNYDLIRYKIQAKFLEYFGRVKVSKYPPFIYIAPKTYALKGIHYYEVIQDLKPGDIVLRGFDDYLDGLFIPGNYSHAGLYVGKMGIGIRQVVHAMTPDVQYTDIVTFMRAERIAIVRPNVSEDDKILAIKKIIANIGKPYDYDFIFEENEVADTRFSCSELIWNGYSHVRKSIGWELTEKKFAFFTKKYFEPDKCLTGDVTLIYSANPK